MIYGERLRLRAAERDDIPLFVKWLNDPEVRQFLFLNQPLSMAQEEHWFDAMLKLPAEEQVLVIEVRAEEAWQPVGNISLMHIDWTNRLAEVGLFIGEKAYWNQGYGREVLRLMLKHGFQTMNLNRIWLRVYEFNQRGIRAYERAGFKHEGRQRQAIYRDGGYYDVLLMSALREEWVGEEKGTV